MKGLDWGSIADWAAAIASLGASITALWLARAAERIKLEGFFGLRDLISSGEPEQFPELVVVHVTNKSMRTAKVSTIAIRTGLPVLRGRFKRRFAIIPVWDATISKPLPTVLDDGDTAQWCIRLDEKDWLGDLCGPQKFVTDWLGVETFRLEVHTRNGGKLVLKPEEPLKARMHEARKASAPA